MGRGATMTVQCLACAFACTACQESTTPPPPPEHVVESAVASAVPPVDRGFPPCPPDMVLVDGELCPEVEQECLEHHPEYVENPESPERCIRYKAPTVCRSSHRQPVRVCVDRYEWPNQKGIKPRVLVDFHQAQRHCASVGKRLCEEREWLMGCEGSDALPYTYGYVRDPTRCVIDRLYVERPTLLHRWDDCMADGECRDAFAALDQREPAGAFDQCVSPFGVHDMNGNVNEWVLVPDARAPHRAGLKGGWWGPVRDRCRPTVRFHDENDWGYEIGFRCCRDPAP